MARLNIVAGGDAAYIKVFATIHCPVDCEPTEHSQRRLIAHWPGHWKAEWHVLVRCSKCNLEYMWYTNEVPQGLQIYHVRVHAQGRVISELNKEVPTMEEEFMLLAPNRQGAYKQSLFSITMPTAGQLVETYIDGVIERDERY